MRVEKKPIKLILVDRDPKRPMNKRISGMIHKRFTNNNDKIIGFIYVLTSLQKKNMLKSYI